MGWLQIVLYVLMNLPKFIEIIKNIIALIKGMPKDQADAVRVKLWDAIEHHKQTGDDSEIQKVCDGIGCAAQPVAG